MYVKLRILYLLFFLQCVNLQLHAENVECLYSQDNDTLIVNDGKVVYGKRLFPVRNDTITACLAHELGVYLVGIIGDTLLVITDVPQLFDNKSVNHVKYKDLQMPYYKCVKTRYGKRRAARLTTDTDTLIFLRDEGADRYSLLKAKTSGMVWAASFFVLPDGIDSFFKTFGPILNFDYKHIYHMVARPLGSHERIWYSEYSIPMHEIKSLYKAIEWNLYRNEYHKGDAYMTEFK